MVAVAAGIGALIWLRTSSGIEFSPESLRDAVAQLGVLGPLAMIGIMTFRPFLFMPSWLVMLVNGMLFGPVLGTVTGAVGGVLGGALIFGIARSLGREAVQGYLRVGAMRAFEEFLVQRGAPWLALYTAIPISPLTPVYAGAGLSRMRFAVFCVATALGFVPRAGLFAVVGRAAVEPSLGNISIAVALGLVAVVGTMLARRWLSAKPSASE